MGTSGGVLLKFGFAGGGLRGLAMAVLSHSYLRTFDVRESVVSLLLLLYWLYGSYCTVFPIRYPRILHAHAPIFIAGMLCICAYEDSSSSRL